MVLAGRLAPPQAAAPRTKMASSCMPHHILGSLAAVLMIALPLIALLGAFSAPKTHGVWRDIAAMATSLVFGILLLGRARRRAGWGMWVSVLAAFAVLGLGQPITTSIDNGFFEPGIRMAFGAYVYAGALVALILV